MANFSRNMNNQIGVMDDKKVKMTLEQAFLEYTEKMNVQVAEFKDWFIFGNSDYNDSGKK